MTSTENQKLAEKLLKILESGSNNPDLAALFAGIEKINHRLDKLEQSSLAPAMSPIAHPSLDKFVIAEAKRDIALIQRRRAGHAVDNQNVARVLAPYDCANRQPVWHVCLKVFERVDAAVHRAPREIDLELLREQPLAADRVERLVELLVTERLVRLELRDDAYARESGLNQPRLPNSAR